MAPSLHHEFLARLQEQPQAIALCWKDQSITYAQLDAWAETLAEQLLQAGVQREQMVALSTSRGPGLVAGMLGVMKAGAAWVPMDPAYPAPRLAHMMEDSSVSCVVADAASAARLPGLRQWVDVDAARPIQPRRDAARAALEPGQLAYMIYTSGSTGRPKGALIEHGGVATTVLGMRDAFGISRGDRVLQFSSMSFDASICEVGVALTAGATLVMADDDERVPGPLLLDLMEREQVSVAVLAPSVAAALPKAELPALRTLVLAGEALSAELVQRWSRRARTIINAYGPTEVAICATVGVVPTTGAQATAKPDIGIALPGVELRVVDEQLHDVRLGTVGELVVTGAGVGRGYWRRPDLTAERFPQTEDGRRMYRTGDLVRQMASGRYDFIGRVDHQIKLNGFRIEPGEVADLLRRHEHVRDAVAMERNGRLVAYVAAPADAAPEALKAWCEQSLPSHMVPSAVVVLESLPLTSSGKVDRAALPLPDRTSGGLSSLPRAASNDTEATLVRLMSELLGGVKVGADDDFFALGGHSLLVGRLAARVREAFAVEMPLSSVYRHPTAAGMAAYIGAKQAGEHSDGPPPVPALRRSTETTPVPLSFPQERIWFLEQIVPGNLAYQAQATLHIRGPLDRGVLNATLTEIVQRHEIFRTSFQPEGGVPMQVVAAPFQVDLPVIDLPAPTDDEFATASAKLIHDEIRRLLPPDRPPLVRWLLLRHHASHHVLLHAEHHLIHDGWSFAVFVDELKQLYEARLAGQPSPLPPPQLQFSDFARWQRQWLDGPALKAYLDHWQGRLAELPLPLALPTDRPRSPAFRFTGQAVREEFAPQEYAALRSAARHHGVTLFSLMLAGFSMLLSRYAEQTDLVVGVGSANRRLAEAERLIGMMINTLPVRVSLHDDPSFAQVLQRVHQWAIEAYAWQDVPLDRLVDRLRPPRDPSRNPLFSVIFSFHDAAVPDLSFGGLKACVQVEHNGSAKADLNIVVIPRAEQRVGRADSEEDEQLSMIWEYADDLFDRSTMQAMLAAYHRLLAAGLDSPETPVSRLPLADAPACDTAATEGAAALRRYKQVVATQPLAIVCRGAQGPGLSYQALDDVAKALVQRMAQVAGSATQAIIDVPPGPGLAVALAACLLRDLPFTIGSAAGKGVLVRAPADCTDAADFEVMDQPSEGDGAPTWLHWAALDASVSALLAEGVPATEVWQLASVGDPAAALGIALALLGGGCVRFGPGSLQSPANVAEWLQAEVTNGRAPLLLLPSRVANALAETHPDALARGSQLVALGADANLRLLAGLQREVFSALGGGASPLLLLRHGTGPTEPWHPVAGLGYEVLDRNGQQVPAGGVGRLHVSTPKKLDSGWRVRPLGSGGFQVIDRAAQWLEIDGFRVVPGHAVQALQAHPAVHDAAVVQHDGQLVAYVATSGTVGIAALQDHLLDRIAAYEAPRAWVLMDQLPLDAQGQLRLDALPAPDAEQSQSTGATASDTEQWVASVCAQLLQMPQVAPRDDFFLLGGRSLLATRLIAQVNRQFGVQVPVARFLRRPTVAALAAAVDELRAAPQATDTLRPSALRNADALLENLDQLSDEEVQRLLADM
jgi:amino acid adenylation domain-containing protein